MGKFVSTNEYLTDCPDCSKQKLYYNTRKEIGWCHYCEKVWFKRDGILVSNDDHVRLEGTGYYGTYSELAVANKLGRKYLEYRHVIPEDMIAFNIQYRDSQVIFPVTSPSPDIPTAYMKRGIDGESGWYFEGGNGDKKNYCFGLGDIPVERTAVLLVEGIFDVLTPGLRGYAIAMLGTNLHDLLLTWLERMKLVVVWLDPGEKEAQKSVQIQKTLKSCGIKSQIILSSAEPGDCHKDSPIINNIKVYLEKHECLRS